METAVLGLLKSKMCELYYQKLCLTPVKNQRFFALISVGLGLESVRT